MRDGCTIRKASCQLLSIEWTQINQPAVEQGSKKGLFLAALTFHSAVHQAGGHHVAEWVEGHAQRLCRAFDGAQLSGHCRCGGGGGVSETSAIKNNGGSRPQKPHVT
jgi:hypothetical protein